MKHNRKETENLLLRLWRAMRYLVPPRARAGYWRDVADHLAGDYTRARAEHRGWSWAVALAGLLFRTLLNVGVLAALTIIDTLHEAWSYAGPRVRPLVRLIKSFRQSKEDGE